MPALAGCARPGAAFHPRVQYCQLAQRSGLTLPSHAPAPGQPYDWLAAIGGLAYVAAIALFRWRG
jgi:hypothetical protein